VLIRNNLTLAQKAITRTSYTRNLKTLYTLKIVPPTPPPPPSHSPDLSVAVVVREIRKIRNHRLNMELDLQSLFGLHVTWFAKLFSLAETPQPPLPFGPYTRGATDQIK
jgi:hypothetical protein